MTICCWIFYDSFYTNGIPEHLKEDTEGSQDGYAPPASPANPPAAPANPPAGTGNNWNIVAVINKTYNPKWKKYLRNN